MIGGLALAAFIAVAGAVAAVAAREPRIGLTGLVLALAAAPLVAEPLPGLNALALRIVGAALAAYLLWPAVRAGRPGLGGSGLGWPALALAAVTVAVIGLAVAAELVVPVPLDTGDPAPQPGPLDPVVLRSGIPTAAGLAVLALASLPVLLPHDTIRLGVGLLLLIDGVMLLRAGLGGRPEALEQLAVVASLLAVAAGVAALARFGAHVGPLRDAGFGAGAGPGAGPGSGA